MVVGFIGCGKLGLPVALAVESKGHTVYGYDVNPDAYKYMEERKIPFQEDGLQPLLDGHNVKMIHSIEEVVQKSDIVFLPIQTPHGPQYEGITPLPNTRDDFDYSYLKKAVSDISDVCEKLDKDVILAVISTCLPGTYEREIKPLLNERVHYVYTPQFIAMGTVLEDYLNPEFNLIGVESEEAADTLESFYKTINDAPCVRTDITTAEGIKVSYNTWITAKTVIANTWGELSHRLGMNFDDIKKAWDLSDKRLLSNRYMDSGVGDGGGCHPRDNIAMSYIANRLDLSNNIFDCLMEAREDHMAWLAEIGLIKSVEYELPLIILGRSFKPETNIETGSPAILMESIIKETGIQFQSVEDIEPVEAVYIIGTKHQRYTEYKFPKGSIVIDPFRFIPEQKGVEVIHIGGKIKTGEK